MFGGQTIAVVVPAFNEADKIAATLRSMPRLVDRVVVVDDASTDATAAVARQEAEGSAGGPRIEVLVHAHNRGVGAAIASGYLAALDAGADVIVVMAGDGQMDPADLPALLTPVVQGAADYAKGNRLGWPQGWREMPPVRLAGSLALSWLTRIATGYRRVSDSQCGYTAAARAALLSIDVRRMYPRYGYPNDLLSRLAGAGARVIDVPVRPVYGAAWRSGLRPTRVVAPLGGILVRAFVDRLRRRVRRFRVVTEKRGPCESGS